ncbi:MAG: hypothetical protein QNJ42_18820 [Crocosphaera sp.]|nr:hypothetical protein [Crocosphaera sp.]
MLLHILCLIFLVATVWFGVDNYQFFKESIPIQGTIINVDRSVTTSSVSRSSKNSYPIIEYKNPITQENKQFKSSVAALNVKIGKTVWIAYRKNKQTEKLISFGELLIPTAVFGLFGVILLVILIPLSESSQVLYWLLKTLHMFKQ